MPRKRPCTNSYRRSDRSSPIPSSHIDPITKRDLNWTQPGFTYSRCAGICDDDIGACYCDGPKHGRVPAPPGGPPGTPPVKQGRLLFDPCHRLTDDGNGTQLQWFGPGGTPWSKVCTGCCCAAAAAVTKLLDQHLSVQVHGFTMECIQTGVQVIATGQSQYQMMATWDPLQYCLMA